MCNKQLHKAPGTASSCPDKELRSCLLLLTGWLWQPACQHRAGQQAQTTFSPRKSNRARGAATALLSLPTPSSVEPRVALLRGWGSTKKICHTKAAAEGRVYLHLLGKLQVSSLCNLGHFPRSRVLITVSRTVASKRKIKGQKIVKIKL